METSVEIFDDHGQQAIRLPKGISLRVRSVIVSQDTDNGEITITPVDERTAQQRKESWDKLLKLIGEIPQEERDMFMILRDPSSPRIPKTLR